MQQAIKKQSKSRFYLHGEGRVKGSKSDSGVLIIEGFANRFSKDNRQLVDRGGDLIPPEAWMLEEFKSLPIIFFNHDRGQPVGKATMVNPTKDGLFIRVKISNSNHPEIARVRDLVKEGILRAFSVGFDPLQEESKEIDGSPVNVITKANLLEVSIVSIPMAQASLFEVTTKSLADMPYQKAVALLTKQEDEDENEEEDELPEDKQDEDEEDDSKQDSEEDEEDEEKQGSFQECVADKIRKLRGEGVGPDEALARALAFCRGEDGKGCQLDFDQLRSLFELAHSITNEKQEAVDQISAVGEDNPDLGDPHLDVAKQTNVLLGQLVREIQLMAQKLDGLVMANTPEDDRSPLPEELEDNIKNENIDDDDEELEKLSLIDIYTKECKKVLERVGC